jgi:hypothetical protein
MMKKIIKLYAISLVCILTFTTNTSFAAGGKVVTSASGVKFATGGIGEDEVTAMHRMANQFSLNIIFSAGAGSAATNVNAVIFNEAGDAVFRIKGAKPLLYVDLPAGKYRILATYHNLKQGYVFNLASEKNQKLILNWPDEIEEDTKE